MRPVGEITSDILVLSFDGLSSPGIEVKFQGNQQGSHPFGWGMAWFPGDSKAAIVAKDPAAKDSIAQRDVAADWEHFRSTVFFCKVRGAARGYTHHETQPFSTNFAGQDWLFMHNGDLDKLELQKLHSNKSWFLEPLGRTDSELAFFFLLGKIQEQGVRTLMEVPHHILLGWFEQLDKLGSADMSISDGNTIAVYYGTKSERAMYYSRFTPPSHPERFDSDSMLLELNDPRDTYRTALVFSSTPFDAGSWLPMQQGQLIVARRGSIIWDNRSQTDQKFIPGSSIQQGMNAKPNFAPMQMEQAQTNLAPAFTPVDATLAPQPVHNSVVNIRSITQTPEGQPLTYRMFDITHTTEYSYDAPVEHSTHAFRLQPVEDPMQEVVSSNFIVSSEGEEIRYEDVFGNQSIHYSINNPYTKLTVQSLSRVKVYAAPPDDHSLSRRQSTIPLVWMPWQREMMASYLLPPELPETQLSELTTYAMSFVERNGFHVMDTLKDINLSIYRDFKYVPGTTSLNTTPFEVYTAREGVCQDFANLLICLARLLSIPARYRMGYIYTGANYENKIQSDASHAWVEIYLPYIGWRGFDPTNGCMVSQDHVRVASGRNYRDATPTSGTIFKGGGTETLTVDVKMNEVLS